MTKLKSKNYKKYVESRLRRLSPFLQLYAMGDFSKSIPIPEEENEFTELLVGLNLMVDDIKELIKDKERTIAELKKLKDALIKEKEFSDTVLNAQQDTFFLFEPATGKAIQWNQAFKDITGYTNEEISILKVPDSYFSPGDIKRAFTFIQEVLKKGRGEIELELICKDGRKIPTEFVVSLIRDEKDEAKYFISIGRSIIDRKKAEEKVKRTMFELEQSNRELEGALNQVKTLSGLIPICSVCKKIRDDEGYWNFLELYLKEHSNAEFTHGLCPECERKLYTQDKK